MDSWHSWYSGWTPGLVLVFLVQSWESWYSRWIPGISGSFLGVLVHSWDSYKEFHLESWHSFQVHQDSAQIPGGRRGGVQSSATSAVCYQSIHVCEGQVLPNYLPLKKLSEKNLGFYKIIAQPSADSFTLCLPESMCKVHPVYHISMLELHTPSSIPN